jgi:hypothetical protein
LPVLKETGRRLAGSHFCRARGDMHFNEGGHEVAAPGLHDFARSLVASGAWSVAAGR